MKTFFIFFLLVSFWANIYSQEVALSFDDAPKGDGSYFTCMERAKTLVEKLRKANVDQVVFFCVTKKIDSTGNEIIKKYSEAGHLIANHSNFHRPLDRVSADSYIKDIITADSILQKYETYTKLFRFPFLHKGDTIAKRDSVRNALEDLGYKDGYVSLGSYDFYFEASFQKWMKENKEIDFEKFKEAYVSIIWDGIKFYDNMAKEVLGRSPKHVLLLHEGDVAALFIDELIDHIRKNGGKIISPSEAYKDSIADYLPEILMDYPCRICAIANDNGFTGKLKHVSADTEYLDRYFLENGIIK